MFRKIMVVAFIINLTSTNIYAAVMGTPGISYTLGSARVIAMGGAYVAVADDANAVFLNPAGLGNSTYIDISASYGNLLGDVNQRSIVGSVGLGGYGKVGFGYSLTGVTSIPLTDSSGNSIGTGDFYNSDTAISYGYPIYEWLLLGAKAHRLFSGFFEYNGEGYGLDMGLLLKPFHNFNVGLLIENTYATDFNWSDGSKEKIIKSATLGLSYRPITEKVLLAMDFRSRNIDQNSNIDSASIGGEITFFDLMKLRLGYLFENNNTSYVETGSAGLGINFLDNFRFDYAYRKWGGMASDEHYFSLGAMI